MGTISRRVQKEVDCTKTVGRQSRTTSRLHSDGTQVLEEYNVQRPIIFIKIRKRGKLYSELLNFPDKRVRILKFNCQRSGMIMYCEKKMENKVYSYI